MKDISLKHVHADISDDRIEEVLSLMIPYTAKLKTIVDTKDRESDEASLNVMTVEELKAVKAIAEQVKHQNLSTIIIVGIGGSNLGTKAVYDALYTKLDIHDTDRRPKILFFDTVSTALAFFIKEQIEQLNSKEEIVVNVISKSGGTMETVASFEFLHQLLSEKFGDVNDRFVLTTTGESKLWHLGRSEGMHVLTLPQMVGGRYSVFTSVGIFPLILAGVDVEELLDGARRMVQLTLHEENMAMMSAAHTYLHREEGMMIHNSFLFNPELESVGKWYRQLMGESIGKQMDLDGKEVFRGITPIVSIGSTDLHSMAQLYFGGPRDKFTNFVYAPSKVKTCMVPQKARFNLVEGIEGKRYDELMEAILEGVKAAYEKNTLPYLEIALPDVSEYSIGQYLQFRMIEMMYLAKMLNVNAFDQPNVEDYKVETKRILAV